MSKAEILNCGIYESQGAESEQEGCFRTIPDPKSLLSLSPVGTQNLEKPLNFNVAINSFPGYQVTC